jgi:hypothetical protein
LDIKSKRLFELLAEVAAGLLLVAACYYWAVQRPTDAFPARWLGFLISTAVLFGYPLHWMRKELTNGKFWFRWLGLLILHVCILGFLLVKIQQWPLIFFVGTTLLEFIFIMPILNAITSKSSGPDTF